MRVLALLLTVVATVGLTGCNNNKTEEATKQADEAAKSAKEADDKAAAKKEADDNAAKSNAETKAKLQKEIDAADRRATYLREKAAKTSGATRKSADAAIADVDTREAAAKVDMAKLEPTETSWDAQKSAVEADITGLKKAVSALDTIVEAK